MTHSAEALLVVFMLAGCAPAASQPDGAMTTTPDIAEPRSQQPVDMGVLQSSDMTAGARPCLFDNQTLASGSTTQGYTSSTVPFGQTCAKETVACNNGALSPSNAVPTCTVASSPSGLIPPPTVVEKGMLTITFDDGRRSQWTTAWPILQPSGVPATFNIITDSIGASFLTFPELLTLQSAGYEIASHTVSHPNLTTLTSAQATTEITQSKATLVAGGITVKTLAYPDCGIDASVEALVKAAGYVGARNCGTTTSSTTDPFNTGGDSVTNGQAGTPGLSLSSIEALITSAIHTNTWFILVIHDVSDDSGVYNNTYGDGYSISSTMLKELLAFVRSSGIAPVTFEDGLKLQSQLAK